MANSDAIFHGKIALQSVSTGQYLSIDQTTGRVTADSGSIGPTQTLIDYFLEEGGPNDSGQDFFCAATPANHGFFMLSACWNGDGMRTPAGCSLMSVAATIDQAVSFQQDFSVNYSQKPGQAQWTAGGLKVMVPNQLGLGTSWCGLQLSGNTVDNLFTTTAVVPSWSTVSCNQGTWRGADLSYVILSNIPGGLTGNAADLTGANLQGADLSGLDLTEVLISSNVNLRDAHLSGATFVAGQDLSGATLVGVDLSDVDLRQVTLSSSVDFTGANLSGAKLDGHDLSSAILNGANLTGATLSGTDLTAAQMLATNFTSTDLTVATFGTQPAFSHDPNARTVFRSAHLPYAIIATNWTGYDLTCATIVGLPSTIASLQATDALLGGLVLDGISFQPKPTFDRSDLTGVSLKGAVLTGAGFNSVTLAKGILTDAQVDGAVFAGSTLDGARLDSSTPGKAVFDNASFSPASLQQVTFANSSAKTAVFSSATMTGAILTGADLTSAKLVGALLYGATLAYGTFTGADFTNAQLGAKQSRFTLPWSFVADLNTGTVSANLRSAFLAQGVTLSTAASLVVRIPSENWVITNGADLYEVVADAATQTLQVLSFLETDAAAVLTQAYMPNAVFTDANLYACHLADVQWYGQSAKGDNADFEEVDFSNANLSASAAEGMVLSQARMFGAKLDHAILVNTDLSGAYLSPSATRVSASLASASLQGTNFSQAHLDSADLTNAAVALAAGVPLFSLTTSLEADLDAGTLSAALSAEFARSGYPLLAGSTVTVVQAGAQWTVNNGGGEPPTTAIGSVYATFSVLGGVSALPVSGSSLWVTQIGDDGHLQTVQVSFAASALDPSIMTSDTVCPNGQPLSAYQQQRYTWEQMMTAATPPTPPSCIPSPTHWCPAEATGPAPDAATGVLAEVQPAARAVATAPVAPGDYPSPNDAAKAVVANHPALLDLDAATAPDVATLIAGLPGLANLATAISSQGAASPTGGWATQTPVGQLGSADVSVDMLSAATVQGALAPLLSGIAAVRSSPTLAAALWTTVVGTVGGSTVVDPPASGFGWTVANVRPRFGVEVTEVSGDVLTRMCQLRLRNAAPRFLGVFAEFVGDDGTPVALPTWQSSLPTALSAVYETATRKYLGLLPPTERIGGVPLGGQEMALQYVLPAGATCTRIVFAGGGVADWHPSAGLGLTATAVLGWAVLGILESAGADPSVYPGLVSNPSIVAEAIAAASAVAGATDLDGALATLAAQIGPWLLGEQLPLLRSALRAIVPDASLVSSAVSLPWPATLAALTAAAAAGAVGVQALAGPATFDLEVPLGLVAPLDLTVVPDPAHGMWPVSAATVTVSLTGDQVSLSASAPAPGFMSATPVPFVFPAVPTDRSISVAVSVRASDGRLVASCSAVAAPSPAARTISVALEEPVVAASATVSFQHAATLAFGGGQYAWEAGPPPMATQAELDCANVENALCELVGLTLDADAAVLGVTWQGTGADVPTCGGQGTLSGQAFAFECLSSGADPNHAAKILPCAFSGPAPLVLSRRGGTAVFVDPRQGAYALRPVSLDPAVPFDTTSQVSVGRFPVSPTDAILSAGLAVAVSSTAHLLQIVKPVMIAVTDAVAPVAFSTGGLGTGVGQLGTPVAVAATLSGAFVVLEAGNRRLQAFDGFGNPFPYFPGDAPTFQLQAPGDPPRTYLDLDVDEDGTMYVLSYGGQGKQASDYRVDVLGADGRALATIPSMAAARIIIAPYLTVYSLGYGTLTGTGPRTQPTVSIWTAGGGQ